MCCGASQPDPDDVVVPYCRICDCNPCRCGSRKYQTDREVRTEQKKRMDEDEWASPTYHGP